MVLALQPSVSPDELARKHIRACRAPPATPSPARGSTPPRRAAGSAAALASYLLFELDFVNALIELARPMPCAERDELHGFFGTPEAACAQMAVPPPLSPPTESFMG